jgi:hypothetical protein
MRIIAGNKKYPETRSIGEFVETDVFFEMAAKHALSRYFVVQTSGQCALERPGIDISLTSFVFHMRSMGPIFPINYAEATASVHLDFSPGMGPTISIDANSGVINGESMLPSNATLIVVSREAIMAALQKGVDKLVCEQNIAPCLNRTEEDLTIPDSQIAREYMKLRNRNETRVRYYFWTVPR